jgi:molybdopterin-guanine dinucleotide biosynthesis protein A
MTAAGGPSAPALPAGLVAVILTGGASRRLGQPKAWVRVGGEPCVARVWAACRTLDVAVEFQGELPGLAEGFPGTPVWPDPRPGLGPLAALVAALQRRPDRPVLLVACDLPFVSPSLLRGVAASLAGVDWAVPVHEGRCHPLCGAYSPRVLATAQALLAQDRRQMRALLEHPALTGLRLEVRPEWGPPDRLLLNVNTAEDLARARYLLGE